MKKNLVILISVSLCAFLLSSAVLLTNARGALSAKPGNSAISKTLACAKAFEALGKIGDPAASDVLIRGLKSREFIVRIYAIEALGRLNDRKAVPYLREQLKDDDHLVKIMSSKALLSLGERDMEAQLLGFLESGDPSVRAAAAEQLGQFKERYMERLSRLLAEDKSDIVKIKVIRQIGINKYAAASGLLAKSLEDSHPHVRQAACIAIGKAGYNEGYRLLLQRLDDPEAVVRAAAKEGLSMLRLGAGPEDDAFLKLLWKDLESKDLVLRASSLVCLSAHGQIKVLPILLKEAVNPSEPMLLKRVAARGLMLLKPAVESSFDEMAKSRQPQLSSQNLELSYRVGGENLITLLTKALSNEKDPLHRDAAGILGELKDRSALPELRQALSLSDPEVVAGVAYVLGLFKDRQAAPSLIRLCKNYGF